MAIVHPTEEERLALCDWLTANGINLDSVPIDSTFAIVDEPDGHRVIHYVEFILTGDGHKQKHPEDPNAAWKRAASAPCTVEPPAWLHVPGGRA